MRRALPSEQRLQIGPMSVDRVVFQRFLLFYIPHQSPRSGVLRPRARALESYGRKVKALLLRKAAALLT